MTPQEFVLWMKGFFSSHAQVSQESWNAVKKQLENVSTDSNQSRYWEYTNSTIGTKKEDKQLLKD
jgi:hypothetical protein